MEKTEELKEKRAAFLAMVNHEIRTPLNGITGLLYLMRQNLHNPERLEEYLNSTEAAAEELKRQLEALLELADTVESCVNLNENRIDLCEFVNHDISRFPVKQEAEAERKDLLHGKKVLVVEDNEINRVIVREVLESWGCQIIQATDGLEAVTAFEKSSWGEIDFILMDIRMPYMNGYEATKKIRSMGRRDAGNVIIIALTANTYQTEADKIKEAGMDGIITKPLHVNALYHLMCAIEKKAEK